LDFLAAGGNEQTGPVVKCLSLGAESLDESLPSIPLRVGSFLWNRMTRSKSFPPAIVSLGLITEKRDAPPAFR